MSGINDVRWFDEPPHALHSWREGCWRSRHQAGRDPHVHTVLIEKVLPMQARLITVADLPG